MGHFGILCAHRLQIEWPLSHWKIGIEKYSKHIGHCSDASKVASSLRDIVESTIIEQTYIMKWAQGTLISIILQGLPRHHHMISLYKKLLLNLLDLRLVEA